VEQLSIYAELANLPLAIAYTEGDLEKGMKRLEHCDVVLVDTPGRGPRQTDDSRAVASWIKKLSPDEVHLALPAGQMPMVTRRTIDAFRPFGITHALATKTDECPDDLRLMDVAVEQMLPMRWLTDGQDVPADLHLASSAYAQAEARVQQHRARRGVAA
ncbi:MAG: hypothetical protein ABUL71_03275, partial [Gemmatimonadota bacterium]